MQASHKRKPKECTCLWETWGHCSGFAFLCSVNSTQPCKNNSNRDYNSKGRSCRWGCAQETPGAVLNSYMYNLGLYQTSQVDVVNVPHRVKEGRLTEVEWLVQGHTARKEQSLMEHALTSHFSPKEGNRTVWWLNCFSGISRSLFLLLLITELTE